MGRQEGLVPWIGSSCFLSWIATREYKTSGASAEPSEQKSVIQVLSYYVIDAAWPFISSAIPIMVLIVHDKSIEVFEVESRRIARRKKHVSYYRVSETVCRSFVIVYSALESCLCLSGLLSCCYCPRTDACARCLKKIKIVCATSFAF